MLLIFFFSFLFSYMGHMVITADLQTVMDKKTNSINKTHSSSPEINTPPQPIKRQLLDFKPAKAPWLKQSPMIQKEVNQIIKKYKKETTKDAKSLFQEFPSSSLLPYKLYVEELKQLKPEDPDIVSVRMIIYTYTGGAHGGKSFYTWNWSKQRKKFLFLNEVITSEQFTTLVAHTRQILFERQKQNDEYDKHRKAHIQRGTSKKKDFKIWNFDRNGIIFIFSEYQVASYAAGSFEVFIPMSTLQ